MGTGNARDAVSTVNIDNDQLSAMKHKPMGKGPLPLILPDEILAVEPAARAPTPPPSTAKIVTNHKRRFLDVETKPPKDIIRGDVRIRVLQENSIILPPKASAASKSVREAWLAGRRVLKGQIAVPRRKLGGGFVRR